MNSKHNIIQLVMCVGWDREQTIFYSKLHPTHSFLPWDSTCYMGHTSMSLPNQPVVAAMGAANQAALVVPVHQVYLAACADKD